ncbi:capsid maturation protease and MuF-like fusion protein [Streptomyces phage Xkcd426]|nr:capsid maturation protease and MuF-like fusion protein [Streptomyces phage Xkcd426]
MTDDELEALLEELEADLREEVQAALSLTARDFAFAVDRSTELVAAAFSVSRIGAMWKRRVKGIMTNIRRIATRGARTAADVLDEPMPSTADLNDELGPYFDAVELQLRAVGDRLSAEAVQSLADGVSAGESQAELQQRMLALFSDTGSQLGPTRAQRIAMTEATSAFNAGTLAAARALTGPERPLVKQWLTRNDERVRQAHRDVNGQLQLLDDPFDVGGTPMQFPGDPSAPADLTINCRCIMRAEAARTADEGTSVDDDEDLSAAAVEHTGAMVALMPSAADAERLALTGGEAVDQLHLTLAYLGEAADWTDEQKLTFTQAVQRASGWLAPVQARAFGVAQWNPHGDSPVWVYNVGDDQDAEGSSLSAVQSEIHYQTMDVGYPVPRQHSPWAPHVAAVYNVADFRGDMVEQLGPVRFDRIRVAFAGEYTDFPLVANPPEEPEYLEETEATEMTEYPITAAWSTPGTTALAFENQQTGDGRVFSPGALYWSGAGPWPLQYADEMMGGHDGAQLAGAINTLGRDGDRIPGSGVLYLTQPAGAEAAMLLAQNAPLGVSVDLDDVDIEMVDATPGGTERYQAKLLRASLLPTEDGGWFLVGDTVPDMAASGTTTTIASQRVHVIVDADGTVPGTLLDLVAAAGDPDASDGVVLDSQRAGDFLLRITRGRVRGATLVTIPAYADARIVLDDASMFASVTDAEVTAALKSTTDYDRVLRHVRSSKEPVGAARLAQFLRLPVAAAQRMLALAASRGEVVRLTRGLYTDKSTSARADHVMMDDLVASVTGAVDLPVAGRDVSWDGDGAKDRVFGWADGDADLIGRAFAYRDDEADPLTQAAYKLGYADVLDGVLTIVPAGVSAAIGALHGARGGTDLPEDERGAVADHLEAVRAHVSEETGEDDMDDMQASAWKAMQDLPAMPAEWFREPTTEELPPGGPGVNYSNGRIFGWVAQAGEPHAGFAKKITIDTLGRIDTSHFLRQRFQLDDGSTVKAGAYTMNVGHHRDGAECETSACQFDDTRTVAGIVTVGMNERGMWFSGAAAPWLSEWDRRIFAATQPSYHMKKSSNGGWQLRAVLGVPVPGHSSPLLASAVIERSQMALTAAATMAEVQDAIQAEEAAQAAEQQTVAAAATLTAAIDYDALADALVAAQQRADDRKAAEEAELAELLAMADKLDVDTTGTEGV